MRKCSSTILYAACTFRPYKSTPVLKLFRTLTGKMTSGLSLRMVFSLLFHDTLLRAAVKSIRACKLSEQFCVTALAVCGEIAVTGEIVPTIVFGFKIIARSDGLPT